MVHCQHNPRTVLVTTSKEDHTLRIVGSKVKFCWKAVIEKERKTMRNVSFSKSLSIKIQCTLSNRYCFIRGAITPMSFGLYSLIHTKMAGVSPESEPVIQRRSRSKLNHDWVCVKCESIIFKGLDLHTNGCCQNKMSWRSKWTCQDFSVDFREDERQNMTRWENKATWK